MGDAEVAALRAVFESNNQLEEWAEWIVGGGLIIELVVLFVFSKEMKCVEKGALILANIIIVIGVLGSGHFASTAADAAGQLQADATTKIANANKANLALEAQIAPRRLKPEQQRLLSDELAIFARLIHLEICVFSYALDAESAVLAGQIIDARNGLFEIIDRRMSQAPFAISHSAYILPAQRIRLLKTLSGRLTAIFGTPRQRQLLARLRHSGGLSEWPLPTHC